MDIGLLSDDDIDAPSLQRWPGAPFVLMSGAEVSTRLTLQASLQTLWVISTLLSRCSQRE